MSRSQPWIRSAPIIASLLLIGAASIVAWPFAVDDAFVVASYARQITGAHGYSVDGTRVSDGLTGPLWLLPFVVAEWLGVASITSAKLVGWLCTLTAVGLVLSRASQRQGSSVLVPAVGALVVCQSDLAIWAIGGLETGAATLALVIATIHAVQARLRRKDHVIVGVAISALAWLRPELAVASAVLLACVWQRDRSHAWIATALACVGAISVVAFRWHMFGHLLPLSMDAKPAELGHGVSYVWTGLTLITGVTGAWLFACGWLRGRSTDRWVAAVVVAQVVAVVLAGGDWMPGFRLLVPVIPLYAWVAAVGVTRLRTPWLGYALLAASCVLPTLSLVVQVPEARAAGQARDHHGAELASWLKRHACHVGLVDVGYLVYAADLRAFDLAGITDESVARLSGGHVSKRIPTTLILERAPDTLVLRARQLRSIEDGVLPAVDWHSRTEHWIAHSPAITSRYRPTHVARYAAGYVYYVLQSDEAQSCPTR